jgi:hypothetical protein
VKNIGDNWLEIYTRFALKSIEKKSEENTVWIVFMKSWLMRTHKNA